MRVRDALLALVARAPAHGYQLKLDYERLTHGGPVNIGQVYQSLERLQRDGLVEREDGRADDRRVVYHATETGRDEARSRLLDTSDVPTPGRSALATKVLLAMQLPGVDPVTVIDAHRHALLETVQRARHDMRGNDLDRASRLVFEADLAITEAELRWLDLCEAELKGGA